MAVSSAVCAAVLAGLLWADFFWYGSGAKPWWWADVFNVGVGVVVSVLVSLAIYWFVEGFPERHRRRLLKDSLRFSYSGLKRDILGAVVAASVKGGRHDLVLTEDDIDKLMEVKAFRAAFDGGRQGHEGFYAFENQMDERTPEFEEIILKLKMLARQVAYALEHYPFEDAELFGYFKQLEMLLMRLEQTEPGYDSSKPLCAFIYRMFTGYSFIEGHRGYDVLGKKIEDM